MNITNLKADITKAVVALGKKTFNLHSLMMVRQMNIEDQTKPEPWLSHWDNDNRVRITMHENVFNKIKADPTMTGLAFKLEKVVATAERAEYTKVIVITPQHVEAVF